MTNKIEARLEVTIKGQGTKVATDLAMASRIFIEFRDANGEGASRTPVAYIKLNGKRWGHISYNGRVWAGSPKNWVPGTVPAYDPFSDEAPMTAEEIAIAEGIEAEADRSRG